MDLEELSYERKEILKKLSELSNDDLKSMEKLVERSDDLLKVLKKDEAWRLVFTAVKTGAGWLMVVAGAVYMGLDKFTAFIKGIVS